MTNFQKNPTPAFSHSLNGGDKGYFDRPDNADKLLHRNPLRTISQFKNQARLAQEAIERVRPGNDRNGQEKFDRDGHQQCAQPDATIREQLAHQGQMSSQVAVLSSDTAVVDWRLSNYTDHQINLREAYFILEDFLQKNRNQLKPLAKHQKKYLERHFRIHAAEPYCWFKLENHDSAYSLKSLLKRDLASKVRDLGDRLAVNKGRNEEERMLLNTTMLAIGALIRQAQEAGVFDQRSRSERGRHYVYHQIQKGEPWSVKHQRSADKRQTSEGLPLKWPEIFARAMDYDPIIDLFFLTGLRPEEVHRTIMWCDKSGQLVIQIDGAKAPEDSDPIWRIICPAMSLPAARRLAENLTQIDFSKVNLESIRGKMARISLEIFGLRISPYTYRHRLVGIIKQIDGPHSQRASMILGHRVDRSSSGYGTITRGGYKKVNLVDPIVSVSIAYPIRVTRSDMFRTQKRANVNRKASNFSQPSVKPR